MVEAVLAIEDRRYYSHPGVDPIRMVGALFTNTFGNRPYLEGAQHHHAAARAQFLPHRGNGDRAADAAALAPPKAARAVHGDRPRHQGDEGRSARALSQRRVPRQPRIVRDSRRGRGGAALFRQGRQQPVARRGRDDRRHHPVARHAVAVQLAGPRARAPQRRAAGDGATPDYISPDAAERASQGAARAGRARARRRSARTSSTSSGRRSPSSSRRSRRPPRPSTSTPRSTCTCSASRRTRCSSGIAKVDQLLSRRRRGRVPQAALIAVDPRTGDILAMVGGRSYNQSQFNRAVERQPAAGIGLQAVRVSRGVRARGRRTAPP